MEIDPTHVIEVQREEIARAHADRVLLMAAIRQQAATIQQLTDAQLTAELEQAKATGN